LYDFDILATTNNEQFINGVYPDQRVVTYAVKKPVKKLFTEDDLFVTDTFSFGTQIGQITNTTSTFVGMMAMFDKDTREYKQLADRVKAGCAAQSRQIDKTKIGENVKTLGSVCKMWQHIDNAKDTPEEIEQKMFYNRILADKKPYFFKYKYKALNKELNEYNKKNDENSQVRFGKTLKQLLDTPKDERTPEEVEFIYYYDKFFPVIDSNCVMNRICKYIEGIDFHIKQKVRNSSDFDYKVLLSQNFTLNNKLYAQVKTTVEKTFKEWEELTKSRKVGKVEKSLGSANIQAKFEREVECGILKQKLEEIVLNEEQLANYLVYLFYVDKPSFSKSTLWMLAGKQIYENVKSKHSSFNFPIKDENGALSFLYEKYQRVNLPIPQPQEKTIDDETYEMMHSLINEQDDDI